MGLFSAIGEIVAAPITVSKTIVDDITNKNGDIAQMLGCSTFGVSGAVRGVAKTIERSAEKLDK